MVSWWHPNLGMQYYHSILNIYSHLHGSVLYHNRYTAVHGFTFNKTTLPGKRRLVAKMYKFVTVQKCIISKSIRPLALAHYIQGKKPLRRKLQSAQSTLSSYNYCFHPFRRGILSPGVTPVRHCRTISAE